MLGFYVAPYSHFTTRKHKTQNTYRAQEAVVIRTVISSFHFIQFNPAPVPENIFPQSVARELFAHVTKIYNILQEVKYTGCFSNALKNVRVNSLVNLKSVV